MLTTCTLARRIDSLEPIIIGWANFAKYEDFKAILAERMSRGYSYVIVEPYKTREVRFNAALKIDLSASNETRAEAEKVFGKLLNNGDISLVHVGQGGKLLAKAETPAEVLANDTVEISV